MQSKVQFLISSECLHSSQRFLPISQVPDNYFHLTIQIKVGIESNSAYQLPNCAISELLGMSFVNDPNVRYLFLSPMVLLRILLPQLFNLERSSDHSSW